MAIDPAAWEAMCLPVRDRYLAVGRNRARRLAIGALHWEARRRRPDAAPARLRLDGRLLVVQPDHLGGVLAATPAFRLIKEALPTCDLTVLAGPWGADVAEHCPAVDRVRTCRFPAFDRTPRARGLFAWFTERLAPYERALATATELRGERFDAALVLVADFWPAAVTALAGIPLRLGFGGGEADRFLTHCRRVETPPVGRAARVLAVGHVAAAQLRLARELVALAGRAAPEAFDERMAYEPTPADRADAVRLWRANDLDEASDVVVMHSAPGGPAKRWPAERFAIVADHISGRLGGQVLLTGGRGDVEEVRKIAARCTRSPVELAGQTSFGALAALFERSRIAIGSDNGAMHLATARGVPTLRLFGPTDARVWEGWNGNVSERPLTVSITSPRVCSPCHRLDIPEWRTVPGARGDAYPCMDEITVETVIDAVERLWRETNAR